MFYDYDLIEKLFSRNSWVVDISSLPKLAHVSSLWVDLVNDVGEFILTLRRFVDSCWYINNIQYSTNIYEFS